MRSDQKFDIIMTVIIIVGLLGVAWLIGKAVHDGTEQSQKFQIECVEKGGEIKYIDRVGDRCTKG